MSAEKIVFTVLFLLLLSSQQNALPDNSIGLLTRDCQNFDLTTVRKSSTGIQILITTASDLKGRNLDLQGYYLPSECGPDLSRCNLATFRYGQRLYILIPSIRGMVAITYNYVNSTDPQFTHQFVPATRSCNIVKIFYTGPNDGYRVIGACMDLPVNSDEGSMYILEYRFRVDENGTGIFVERKSSIAETIYNPDTVSEVVYARGQGQCSYQDNVYFIDDGYVIQSPVDRNTIGGQFEVSFDYFRGCSTFEQIEHFGGSDIVVYCANNTAVVHNTCADSSEYYDSSESGRGIPYPCSNWEKVVYLKNNNTLSFNNQEIPLPYFEPVVYGRCIAGDPPTFIALTSNRTISVVLNEGGNASIHIISNGCNSTTNSDCFRPTFSLEDENILGTFDTRNSFEFVVANFSKSCGEDPIFFRLHIPTQPDLAAISLRSDIYNCTCTPKDIYVKDLPAQIDTQGTTTSPVTNDTATNDTDTDLKINPPAEEAHHTLVMTLVSIAVFVGILVVVAVLVVIFAIRCRSKRRVGKYTDIHQLNERQNTTTDCKRARQTTAITAATITIVAAPLKDTSGAGQEEEEESQDTLTNPIPESACRYGGVDVANGSSLPHPSSNYCNGRAGSYTIINTSQHNNNNNVTKC